MLPAAGFIKECLRANPRYILNVLVLRHNIACPQWPKCTARVIRSCLPSAVHLLAAKTARHHQLCASVVRSHSSRRHVGQVLGRPAAATAAAAHQGMSTRAERRALQTQQRNQKALSQMLAERTCEIVLVRHGETAYNAEERLQASCAAGMGGQCCQQGVHLDVHFGPDRGLHCTLTHDFQ